MAPVLALSLLGIVMDQQAQMAPVRQWMEERHPALNLANSPSKNRRTTRGIRIDPDGAWMMQTARKQAES
jgi:hypothetical protein